MIIQQNIKVKHKTLLSIVFASTFTATLTEGVQNCNNSNEQINPTFYDEEAAMQCDLSERQMEIFPVVQKCAIEQALYFSIAHYLIASNVFIREQNFATEYYTSAYEWCIYSLQPYTTIFVLCLFRLARNENSTLNYKVSKVVKEFLIVALVGGVDLELVVSSDISGGVKIAQDKFTAIRIFTNFMKLYIVFAVVNNYKILYACWRILQNYAELNECFNGQN